MAQGPNPLVANRVAPQRNAAMAHAQMWRQVNAMDPGDVAAKMQQVSAVTPILGKLAGDPRVTRKDVIRAAADAAGSGVVPAVQAVSFLSQMPDDPTKLQGWLRGMYAANLTALVHLKAAAMPGEAQP